MHQMPDQIKNFNDLGRELSKNANIQSSAFDSWGP